MIDNKLISLTFLTLVLSIGLVFSGTFVAFGQEKVTFATSFGGHELDVLQNLMKKFEEDTGIKVEVQQVSRDMKTVLGSRVEGGNPPDMANVPNPGFMKRFIKTGALASMDWFKETKQAEKIREGFLNAASYNGTLYGVMIVASNKSLVWYNKKVFEKEGYEVPENLGELITLQNEMIGDGYVPWTVGLESGAATGWPGTDWIEDIMLRIAGPEVYDKWVNHDIPWTDPRVAEAFRVFDLFVNNDMTMGGRKAALTMNFGDAVQYILPGEGRDKPRALMHRQATFIKDFLESARPEAEVGVDYDAFTFPGVGKGTPPILAGGDFFIVFNDKPAVRKLIKYFASAGPQETWVHENPGRLAVNQDVPLSAYSSEIIRKTAKILREAKVTRIDGSDKMSAAVGSGSFWSGIVDYVQGKSTLDKVLKTLEQSADDAYDSGEATD